MTQDANPYLVIAPAYPPPHIGGSKVWTFNMVEHCPADMDILTSALKEGCEEVASPRHNVFRHRQLWDSNIANPTARDLFVSYGYILWWLFRRSRRVRYQAVVAGAFDFANGWIILLCRCLRIPIIALGNAEEFTLTLQGRGVKNAVKRAWLKFTHPKADGFIVVCHFCKEVLASIGVDPRTVHVVPSSINPRKLHRPKDWGAPGYRILSVGRIVERKGFHCLIEAVRRLKPLLPAISLTIVGDGPYLPVLQDLVARHRLQDDIYLKGTLPDAELSQLYRTSDLFVLAHMMLPNGDTEGCPTVFSEASGCGLPVIGGVEGGASTVILDGVTGYIVDARNIDALADRIRTILTNPTLARQMGEAGLSKIRKEHTPEVTGQNFYAAIRTIATKSDVAKAPAAAHPPA